MGKTILRVLKPRPTGPWPLSAVTVNFDPSRGAAAELKRAAISRVEHWLALGPRSRHPHPRDSFHSGAVILVSQSLAGWLDDDVFVSRLLTASGMSNSQDAELSVLTAAVDEVPRYDRRIDTFSSSEGISVLRGQTSKLLPTLFDPEHVSQPDSQASLMFQRSPAKLGELAVHVPLANTSFSNGRLNALFASRWLANARHPPTLTQKISRTNQTVVLPVEDLQFKANNPLTTVRPHLVPVTSPVLALRSLGNILSQVEVDGRPAPPSQELEYIIPRLLRAPRKLRDDGPDNHHIAVWALVMPPGRSTRFLPTLNPLPIDNYDPDVEWDLARETAKKMDSYLISGCRLHKVVSGGGGWGAKQGLLSLDPEVQLTASDQSSLDSFKTSFFEGPNSHGSPTNIHRISHPDSDSNPASSFSRTRPTTPSSTNSSSSILNPNPSTLLPPGSLVQFFVEAAYPTPSQALADWSRDWDPAESSDTVTTAFGTPGAAVDALPADAGSVRSQPSLFGAVSGTGVFLARSGLKGLPDLRAKMDCPRSYLVARTDPGRVARV